MKVLDDKKSRIPVNVLDKWTMEQVALFQFIFSWCVIKENNDRSEEQCLTKPMNITVKVCAL